MSSIASKPRTRCGAPPDAGRKRTSMFSVAARSETPAPNTFNCVARLFVDQQPFNWTRPFDANESREGVGSASVIRVDKESGDVFLLTAYHVVEDCARIWATFALLGKQRFEAIMLGASPAVDAALLLVRGAVMRKNEASAKIEAILIGDADELHVNDEVTAVGYPLSTFSVWSTRGVLAGREGSTGKLQIAAGVNGGNSGGPGLDARGRQIGIVVARHNGGEAMAYATSLSQVLPRIEEIFRYFYAQPKPLDLSRYKPLFVEVPSFNAILGESSDALLRSLDVPQRETGAFVRFVLPGTPLAPHVHAGDVLLRVDGCPVDNNGFVAVPYWEERLHVDTLLLSASLGETFSFTVWRDGEQHEFSVPLTDGDRFAVRLFYPQFEQVDYETFGGIVAMMLASNHLRDDQNLRMRYAFAISEPSVRADSFVIVTSVQSGSSLSGLPLIEHGDAIVRVNGFDVATLDEYRDALLHPMQNAQGGWFVRWETRDGQATVLPYAVALNETLEFGEKFGYRPSRGTRGVLRMIRDRLGAGEPLPADVLETAKQIASKARRERND